VRTQKTSAKRARGPRPQRKRRGGNNNARIRKFGFGPPGSGNGETMGGGYITNPRTEPKSDVHSFDERIATVNGSVAFAVLNTFALNPANSTTFPWLNNIAKLYERYKFEELNICFQHDVSQFATQGQTGSLYLSALYDASAPAPTNAIQIADTDPRVFGMPNENMCLRLSPNSMHPAGVPKFCRPGIVPGQTDVKEYDAGNFFYSATGCQNASECGFLQIKGKVRLFTRILEGATTSAPINNSVSTFSETGGSGALTTTVAKTIQFAEVNAQNVNPLAIVNVAGVFTPPAGNYNIDYFQTITNSVAGTLVTASFTLQKNGVATPSLMNMEDASVGAATQLNGFGNYFISFNGTDTCQVVIVATFAAGAESFSRGVMRFTAI
jgi:hypothetical protein